MLAAIWVEFRDECRIRGQDPEQQLEDWIVEEQMLKQAAKMGHRPNKSDSGRSWGDNDRVALSLLAQTKNE